MSKYTTESAGSRARVDAMMKPEAMPAEPATMRAQKVDPSVTIGPLTGEIRGAVPLADTMKKSAAYEPKKGTP